MDPIRGLVEDPIYEKSRDAIDKDVRRMDEFLAGVTFILARNPFVGEQVAPGSPVRCIHQSGAAGSPSVVLYYTFDDHHVFLLDIEKTALPQF